MAVSRDGLVLASIGRLKFANGWKGGAPTEKPLEVVYLDEVGTGERGATIKFLPNFDVSSVGPVAISPDGATVAVGDWDRLAVSKASKPAPVIRVWDIATSAEVAVLPVHSGQGEYLGYTSDGKTLLAALRSSPNVARVERWSTDDWRPCPRTVLAVAAESEITISPDGLSLVEGSRTDASITFREIASGRVCSVFWPSKRSGSTTPSFDLLFSPGGDTLAVTRLGGVEFWDIRSGTQRSRFPSIRLGSQNRSPMAFSADGRKLAIAGSRTLNDESIDRMVRWAAGIVPMNIPPMITVGLVSVVDVASGRLERSFEIANQRWVSSIGFASSDETIVTEGIDSSRNGSRTRADPTLRTFWDWAGPP